MKKTILSMALMAVMGWAAPQSANAQLLNSLKSAAKSVASSATSSAVSKATSKATSSSTTGSTLTSAASSLLGSTVSKLLGTSTVSESSVVGTWTYQEPCVVMESSNTLANLGSSLITNKIQKPLKNTLVKAGFTAGKVVLTLNEDKSALINNRGKNINATWAVDGSNLVLTVLSKKISINCKMDGSNMQLAMNAKKMLSLLQAMGSNVSSLGTITSLLNKYDGLYLGLQFTK